MEDTGLRALTGEEAEDGFESLWVGLGEARRLMEECVPTTKFGKMVKRREG